MKRRTFLKNSLGAFSAAALNLQVLSQQAQAVINSGLREIYKDAFLMGTMLPLRKFLVPEPAYMNIVQREFNSITTENIFKWGYVHPLDNEWTWEYTDRFVAFGEANHMHLVGHNLVSSAALPSGLFVQDADTLVNKEVLTAKLENHIGTLVGRYKGRIHAWDVVNEAIDYREPQWSKNFWYRIIGPEYVERAFHLAHEADPEATLIYNDYNMFDPGRREFIVGMIRDFKNRGVPLHAIGMQGHFSLNGPDLEEVEASIVAFANEGVQVHFTEMEVDVLPEVPLMQAVANSPELDIYKDGLPANIQQKLRERYEAIFSLLVKHHEKIDRVTLWGTTDDDSWKNDFPVVGRTNHPLLFDRDNQAKPAWQGVAAASKTEK